MFRWNIEGGGLFLSAFRLDFPIWIGRSGHIKSQRSWAVCVALGVQCARSCPPLVFIGPAPMLNDTTKPGEVLHKGGLDLLTLLHRRDVELHAHLTLWCSNDDQQRCEHFDHGFITRPSSPRLPFRGGPHDRQNIGRRRQIASSASEGNPLHARFCCGGVPGPFVRKGEQRSRYANGCGGLVFLRRKENPATAWQLVAGLPAPLPSFRGKKIWGPLGQRFRRPRVPEPSRSDRITVPNSDAEIPFMKVLGDLQLKLGAPHELMMLSSHPLSHQDFEVFIGVPQRELLAPFEGFTEIQENELPDKLIALVIREDEFDERFPAIAAKRRAATKR